MYFVSFKDSLKRVSFEDTTLTFKVYTLHGGVYTEYSFYLETTNPEDTCEFMRDLQDAKYVRVDE